jgi:hypothetical protein
VFKLLKVLPSCWAVLHTTANPQPGLMNDDLRFYVSVLRELRGDSVRVRNSAAHPSKDTAKDGDGRSGTSVDGNKCVFSERASPGFARLVEWVCPVVESVEEIFRRK